MQCLPGDIYSTNVRTLHQYVPPSSKDFICSDSLEVSIAIVLSAINQFDCLNLKKKRAISKRLSVTKNYFYNVSPQTSTILLPLRSGDVSTNPAPPPPPPPIPECKRNYTAKNPCSRCIIVVVAAKESLPTREQFRVTPVGSGHTTCVQVCLAMKGIMS